MFGSVLPDAGEPPEVIAPVLRQMSRSGTVNDAEAAFLENVLTSKWESLQLAAARMLAQSGRKRSVPALKRLLLNLLDRPRSVDVACASAKAVSELWEDRWGPCVLDWFYSESAKRDVGKVGCCAALMPLVARVDKALIRERALKEMKEVSPSRRYAAAVSIIHFLPTAVSRPMLERMVSDTHPVVAWIARNALRFREDP